MFTKVKREEGQGLVEYALILVLVAVVVILVLTILGGTVTAVFARVIAGMNGQTLTGQGIEAIVSSHEATVGKVAGQCQVTLQDVSVIVMEDGGLLKSGSASLPVTVNGSSSGNIGITTNSSGVGKLNQIGPYSGTCPLRINIGGSELRFN